MPNRLCSLKCLLPMIAFYVKVSSWWTCEHGSMSNRLGGKLQPLIAPLQNLAV